LGNRSRIFKHLENPTKDSIYKLPLIVIHRTGLVKNNDRLANINNEVKYATHSSKLDYNLYTPVPIDISYEVTIISKYQEHIDRAISNFIPFFNKDLYVRCRHPKINGLFFTNQVIMEDSISEENPYELDSSTDDLVQCTCNFTFKTYMFCGNKMSQLVPDGFITDTIISTDIDTGISSEIHIQYPPSNPELSTIIPDKPLIPNMNVMYMGFYPVPLLSQYNQYFDWVNSLSNTVIGVGVDGKDITTSAEYYPYVDRFSWKFDEFDIIMD
jgi:hypothetical protein